MPARAARIKEVQKEREALMAEIDAASKARAKFLDDRAAEKAKAGEKDDGFDAVAKRALKKSVVAEPLSGLKL